MPKSPNQKLKLLYIMRLLLEQSDENHPVSISEIIKYLNSFDIAAERKSIYADIESLRLFGMDILQQRGPGGGYYVVGRYFELPELKLLVDSVQSSKFITYSKTLSLIKKIEGLASVHEARMLHRQVYVKKRIKSMNESIYYNVDEIHNGISQDCKIRFKYFEYSLSKERIYRHGKEYYYVISPFALTYDDDNYYMIGYDGENGIIKHFRVDKMTDISVVPEKRNGHDCFRNFDLSEYFKIHFGMFTGKAEKVTLEFANSLIGAAIDRFGMDTVIVPSDDGHFRITADVAVSPQFFGWLCGFGNEVRIVSPTNVVKQMQEHISSIEMLYRNC